MTDFDYDSMQKKRIAASAYKRVRGRRGCRLPFENLTKREVNAMNGDVKTYNLSKPMTREEFTRLPTDLQQEYLRELQQRFHINDTMLGEMLGVHPLTAGKIRRTLSVANIGLGGASRPSEAQREDWCRWLHGEEPDENPDAGLTAVEESPTTSAAEEPPTTSAAEEPPTTSAAEEPPALPAAEDSLAGLTFLDLQLRNIHSWEELYAMLHGIPFPDDAVSVRLEMGVGNG